jgi:hypothetical protein
MQNNTFFGRVVPGMKVYDMSGEKIGEISRVYRYPVAAGSSSESSTEPAQHDIIEVKTGWFGMGQHYYIPTSAIDDGLEESVFVSKKREDLDNIGWNVKPPEIEDQD